MLIFLHGPDSYRKQKKSEELISAYSEKNQSFSVESFDLEENDNFDKFDGFLKNRSLFEEKKLAIIKNFEENELVKDIFLKFIENQNISIIVLAETVPKGFDFLLKKPVFSQEFSKLTKQQILFFVEQEFLKRKIKISEKATNVLVNNFGSDTWGIINEIEKISLFGEGLIEINHIFDLVDLKEDPNLFSFVNAVKFKYPSLPHLEKLFSLKEDAAKIFNILSSQLYGSSMELAASYDLAIKSGKLDYEEALLGLSLKTIEK